MEAKHTPGPWSVMVGDNYEIRSPLLPREYPHKCKEDSTGDFVAYVGNHAPDFGEANANLIATAPNLLRSLIDCEARLSLLVASGRSKMLDAVAAEHARAVIAAALGHNDRVEGRDAASSRRVPSHDGLCGNGNYNERTEK